MNEINPSSSHTDLPKAIPKQAAEVSKKLASKHVNDGPATQQVNATQEVNELGKTRELSSPETTDQKQNRELIHAENIENTVKELNNYVQSLNRSIQFAYDREAGKTVITVTDEDTGKVIRRIPEDLLLELAKKMRDKEPIEMVNLQA